MISAAQRVQPQQCQMFLVSMVYELERKSMVAGGTTQALQIKFRCRRSLGTSRNSILLLGRKGSNFRRSRTFDLEPAASLTQRQGHLIHSTQRRGLPIPSTHLLASQAPEHTTSKQRQVLLSLPAPGQSRRIPVVGA